jgi:membrane-bound lytic murein transglycosylase D
MAYNAGQYRIRRLIPSGPAPEQPVIPDLSVSATTRNHLTQLLAMACVVRHPRQFGVTLPMPAPDTRLQVLQLPAPSTLRAVARAAGLPLRQVRALNGGYRHNRMPGTGPWRVLLPETAVARLRQALADGHLPRQPEVYTVVAGDNLWDIAHRLDMSVAQLQTLNHMHDADLHPGQVLKISATD